MRSSNHIKSSKGSVIIACMLVAVVVAVVCGAYLSGVLGDYKLSVRSLKNNTALNLAEAGIDAAMFDLKQKAVGGSGSTWSSVTSGSTVYYKKTVISDKDLGQGSKGYVYAIIDNLDDTVNGPILTAQGRVTQPGGPAIVKQVKVWLKPLKGGSIPGPVSKRTVNTNGSTVVYDAYDSKFGAYGAAVPAGSVPARGTFRSVNGQLVNICDGITFTVLDQGEMFNINKNIIYGKIALGGGSSQGAAGNFSDRIGWQKDNDNGGSVFTAATTSVYANPAHYNSADPTKPKQNEKPVLYSGTGQKAAYLDTAAVQTNTTFTMPEIEPKPTTGTIVYAPTDKDVPLVLGTPGATSPTTYILRLQNNPNETNNVNLDLEGGKYIKVQGPSVLVVDGAFQTNGNSTAIKILNTGNASLKMFVKNNLNIGGAALVNDNWNPDTFIVIPTGDSGQNISLGGTGAFCGTFLGPTFNVNINGNAAWFGSVVANQMSIVGTGGFHFDVSSGSWMGGTSGYTIKQWVELTDVAGTTYKRDSRLTSGS